MLMVMTIFLALSLLFCQAQSQLCGPGLFSGALGFENGLYGSGPFGPLAQSFNAAPSCVQPVPPCGIQVPPCGIQVPPCGIQVPPCGIQSPPCGLQGPPCGIQVPSCGIQSPPCGTCGIQSPPCGIQVPPCSIQSPPCGIQSPPCGIQAPCGIQTPVFNNIAPTFIPNQACGQCSSLPSNQPCGQCSPLGSNLVPIIAPPCASVCDCSIPQIPVTPVIDNTLANSLANAIQLLIVSNLLESTLTTPCANSLGYSPICEPSYPCANVIEILSPDYYPCNQVLACEPVYETIVAPYIEIPCYQEPIVTYAPCMEINPCGPVFGPTFGSELAFDSCGIVNPYSNNYGCSDICGVVNPFPNNFGCSDNCCLVNPIGNGFGCMDSVFSPVAAEVVFPAEIPAQLLCNFGYTQTNVPCVSVNVEALPFDSCSCNNGFIF